MFSGIRALVSTAFLSSLLAGVPFMPSLEIFSSLMGDLCKVTDYQNQMRQINDIREEMEERDAFIIQSINAKSLTIESLKNKDIDHLEAASLFKYLNTFNNRNLEIVHSTVENLSPEVQACINLAQWLKVSNDEILDADCGFFEMVRSKVEKGENIHLPLPLVKLLVEFGI
jgi:hypothetical protein